MRSTPGLGRLGARLPEIGGVSVNARALSFPSVGSWVAWASSVAALLHAHAQSDHTLALCVGLVLGVVCSQMPGNRGNWQHVACDRPAGTAVLPQAHEWQACTAGPQLAQCCGEPALHVFVCPTARPEFHISIASVTIQ